MKIKLKRFLVILTFFLTFFEANSQTIAVKSFRKLETDQEARISSPKTDQNGKKCAIIKVVTSQTGFVFDFGLIGNALATEQKTAEIWVWVPAGARKVTIKHQQLGVLRDYLFNVDIDEATVYEMILTTGKVEITIKEDQIALQWLVINSTPTGADIYIDDQPANQTPYQRELPLGKHTYRLSHDMYLPTAGSIILNADKKEIINSVLKPDFGKLNISTSPENGAAVSIDGQPTGKITPCTLDQVKSGEHTLTLRLNMYKTVTEKFTLQAGTDLSLPLTLTPTFSVVTINTNPASDIYIAGELKGNGTWKGRLLPGFYLFEARKDKYTSVSEKHEVITGQALNLTFQPIAKNGILKVISTPNDATILFDGANKGTTPATLRNLLIGDYTLSLSLPGYATINKTITITEGQTTEVNETLVNGRAVTINSNPTGANLSIDGNHVGLTPYIGNLTFGSHTLRIEQNGKNAEKTITIAQSGGETSFVLSFVETFTDIDGNKYHTVTIGTQVWMVENLKTTKYNDGTAIPKISDNTAWENLKTPGYCWYNNDETTYKNTYGALYNWYTINTGKLAPKGWHVPSDAEWSTLSTYLGDETKAGGQLKEIGTAHWSLPNTGATNEIGFTALPAGYRGSSGTFSNVGSGGIWWSSAEYNASDAWYRSMTYSYSNVSRYRNGKEYGFSVRCVRDY